MIPVVAGVLSVWALSALVAAVWRATYSYRTRRLIRARGHMPIYRSYADQWHMTNRRHKEAP